MKNILKYTSLIVLVIVMLVALVGCGNKTIIATKTDTADIVGEYELKLTINFEGDVIDAIKVNMEFKNEKVANLILSGENKTDVEIEKEGNSVYIEMTAEEYKETYGSDFTTMSKDEIIQQLKDEGFNVTEE
ncbi:MAG: hypothetical protein IJN50_05410 [Clostridia bacterium]|nr:hypothetical protein [Clostridia bacterium]